MLITKLFAFMATAWLFHVTKAVTSYPLTCVGGGSLSIQNEANNKIKVYFDPSDGAAHQGVNPGECTWSDRAFRPGEPTAFCDNSSRAVQYVESLIQSDKATILQVYNDRNGCMQVTRVGP